MDWVKMEMPKCAMGWNFFCSSPKKGFTLENRTCFNLACPPKSFTNSHSQKALWERGPFSWFIICYYRGRCFLLTPKLLPDMEYIDAYRILNIMNGLWIEKPESVRARVNISY
ncbi:hypothetical protein AAC387_Pa09g1148 [Persea americana]